MKKIICLLCLAMIITLSGCGKDEETKVEDPKVEINENSVYALANKPTDCQIELYNELSDALEDGTEQEIAEAVAKNFVADFYTLKNKANSEDIGGLTYLPEDKRIDFAAYASIYAYANYEKIVQQHGKKNLPAVKSVEVSGTVEDIYTYSKTIPADPVTGAGEQKITDDYDGFEVTLTVAFAKTKVNELPTTLTLTVIEMDGVYRVIEML